MKTFAVQTLGCKVNQYESQQVRQTLEQFGLHCAKRSQRPDIVVVNTCCVTHIASAKSRQKIRKVQKNYPESSIIVTGCLAEGQDHEMKDIQDIIIARDKNDLPGILDRLIEELVHASTESMYSKPINHCKIKDKNNNFTFLSPSKKPSNIRNSPTIKEQYNSHSDFKKHKRDTASTDKLPILTHYTGQCRAFLKVQDGCDAYCTYCIIPKIRSNVCNKPVKKVLQEAKNLVRAGHREIILTGIFLGGYGQTTARRRKWDPTKADSLANLLDQVAGIDNLDRLRLSSLEPLDVTNRLLEVMKNHSNIMPHLHLPLQAGSANVLRKMARQYTIDDYLRVIDSVKSSFDRPAITTDIIVGYPGETEDDFNKTVDVSNLVGFSKIHVFSFSLRKNTPAVKMAKLFGTVPPAEIKRRSAVLQQLDAQLQKQYRQSCRGLKETVLVEKARPLQGRTTRYFLVDLSNHPDAKKLKKNQLVEISA